MIAINIRAIKFNDVVKRPSLLKRLRELTLEPYSGMNYELTRMTRDAKTRTVNAKVLLAYSGAKLVAWALLSNEETDFDFFNTWNGFSPSNGTLFEVYVHPDYRRQGIGSELMKSAKRRVKSKPLNICRHDFRSRQFYEGFERYGLKDL
jgi:GNAT superfamily N-acetyltransferase